MKQGTRIVITAPLTESIDHAGYFIQMALASIPVWMERFIDRKYPNWREVKRFEDGSAKVAPAGVRTLEKILQREFGEGTRAMKPIVICVMLDHTGCDFLLDWID